MKNLIVIVSGWAAVAALIVGVMIFQYAEAQEADPEIILPIEEEQIEPIPQLDWSDLTDEDLETIEKIKQIRRYEKQRDYLESRISDIRSTI